MRVYGSLFLWYRKGGERGGYRINKGREENRGCEEKWIMISDPEKDCESDPDCKTDLNCKSEDESDDESDSDSRCECGWVCRM